MHSNKTYIQNDTNGGMISMAILNGLLANSDKDADTYDSTSIKFLS